MLTKNPLNQDLLVDVADQTKHHIAIFVAVSGVINLLSLTIPLYILTVFDRVLSSQSVDTLAFLTVAAFVALATHSALDALRAVVAQRLADWWASFVAPHVLARSVERRLVDDGFRLEMLREVSQLRNFFGSSAVTTLMDLPWLPIFLIISFLIHPLIGTVALIGGMLLGLIAYLTQRRTRENIKRSVVASQKELRLGESLIRNAEVIDGMGMGSAMLGRWQKLLDEELKISAEIGGISAAGTGISRFIRAGTQVSLYGVAATLVIANEITPGAMIAGSIIAARLLSPIEGVFNNWRGLLLARESYGRLQTFFTRCQPRLNRTSLPKPKGSLVAERVTVQIPERRLPILRAVSFSIEAGEQLAVVGPAASGKTTLVRAMLGTIKPLTGVVRIGGSDVFSLDRSDFGQHCGYLPQGVELFEGTVAENICRFGQASDQEIIRAARIAGCHELILELPDGYDTHLVPGLPVLSGGQAQQIALARAVFGRPSVVILDEPNANLDMKGERALRNCLVRLKKLGVTVVVISHRRSILAVVDKLLVLQGGTVRNFGPVGDVVRSMAKRSEAEDAQLDRTLRDPGTKKPSREKTKASTSTVAEVEGAK